MCESVLYALLVIATVSPEVAHPVADIFLQALDS